MVQRSVKGRSWKEWVEVSGDYSEAEKGRHAALCALKTSRWQHLLKRLGESVARWWMADLLKQAEGYDTSALKNDEHAARPGWDNPWWKEHAERDRERAAMCRQRAAELEAWACGIWPE